MPVAAPVSAKNVIVADDTAFVRDRFQTALQSIGHTATAVRDASELLAHVRAGAGKVDLVVLDLNMPDIHGLEVLRFMRSHSSFQQTPVVILTTRDDEESRGAAYRDGATLYLTKPFRPDSLAPEIKRLLAENSVG